MKQNRRMQYFASFGVSLAILTNAVAYFWTAPILPKFLNNETGINMTSSEVSWVVAVISPGTVTGSVVASVVSDKLGRRTTILGSAFPFVTGTICVLCASRAWLLYLARFQWGCGAGMISTVSTMYLSEIADKDIRGTLTAGTRIMFNLGATMVLIIGSFVSYRTLTYMLMGLVLSYFMACWWIPETPYYLLKEGRVDRARKEILKLSGCKDDKEIEDRLSLMRSDVNREMARSGSIKELFTRRQYRKAIIISAGLKLTQIMAGSIPIQQYLGTIIQESAGGVEVSTALIVFGTVRFAVGFISSFIVDKVGRRPLLIYSHLGAAITLALIGLYFFLHTFINLNDYQYFVLVGIVLSSVIANLGFDTLIFVIPAEIFPLNVKATAMTIFNVYTAFVTFSANRGYQMLKDSVGLHGVFWFFATSSIFGSIFTYFVLPETKGKSLKEIQMVLQGDAFEETDEKHVIISDPEREDVQGGIELKGVKVTEKVLTG